MLTLKSMLLKRIKLPLCGQNTVVFHLGWDRGSCSSV